MQFGEFIQILRVRLKPPDCRKTRLFGAQVVEVKATSYAFAALCGHGPGRRVVTWGDSKQGPLAKNLRRSERNDRELM